MWRIAESVRHPDLFASTLGGLMTREEKRQEAAILAFNRALRKKEAMGEALFNLSDNLWKSGFLNDEANHERYERVVAAWAALSNDLRVENYDR
jgi:hypothetical protein